MGRKILVKTADLNPEATEDPDVLKKLEKDLNDPKMSRHHDKTDAKVRLIGIDTNSSL
jgi:hypothetical protein